MGGAERDDQVPLPDGWEQARTADDRHYFINHKAHSTTYADPRTNRNPELSPDGPGLPNGWEARCTPEGWTYFIDHNTKTTTWVHPRTGRATSGSLDRKSEDVGPLPPEWEARRSTAGK